MSTNVEDKGLSRLTFLQASGALVFAFSLPVALQAGAARAAGKAAGLYPEPDPTKLDSWLAIAPDGSVTVYCGKVELGSGVQTGMAQIAAEELDVAFDQVTVMNNDTTLVPDQGITAGSRAIWTAGPTIRQVAADARAVLLRHAAAHLGAPVQALTVKNGVVQVQGSSAKSISYGDLIGGRHFATSVPVTDNGVRHGLLGFNVTGRAKPKHPSAYTIVGQSIARVDIPEKVTGKATFIQDVKIPGMLHGRVIRPSGLGSNVLSVGKPPSGVQVLRKKSFLGVVAEDEWTVAQAAQSLDVTWSEWKGLPDMADLYTYIRATASTYQVYASGGNTDAALGSAKQTLQATYTTPYETHGSIGPSCAIADVKADSATIWTFTQYPDGIRATAAAYLGIPADNIRVFWYPGSGCYGTNGADPATLDAVIMSKLAGRPVRVQWMRWDEHGWDPKGPASVHDLVGGMDATGKVIAWHHEAWLPSNSSTQCIGTILTGNPVGRETIGGFDGPMVYNFANFDQVQHAFGNLGAHTGDSPGLISSYLRSPGQFQVTFAMESFIDELAAAAGVDPLHFRLQHVSEPRLAVLLQAVAKASGWQSRPSPQRGALHSTAKIVTGRGVAISNRNGSLNAQVAEVSVNRVTGKVSVTHVWAAQDNGLTINPRAVKLHMETAITQTVSRTLLEEVTFDQSNVTSTTWATYPILTFMDAPPIETILIDRPELPATGVGEASVNPVAPSIANAIFDATGVRMRALPFRPDRVKAALQQALAQGKRAQAEKA